VNVTVLTAIGDPRREAEVAAGLSDSAAGLTVVRRCVDLPDLLAAAAAGLAQVAVLSADLRKLDRTAVRRLADAGVVVVGLTTDDVASHERLHRLGVNRLVSGALPSAQLAAAVLDAVTAPDHTVPPAPIVPGEPERGRVIAVWGTGGAPGRSTIALNLAAELSGLGRQVLCADLDTYGPSLGQLAGLLIDEASGVATACRYANNGRLGLDSLRETAAEVRPGLSLLTGISSPARWPELRPAALEMLIAVGKAAYDFIVLDVSPCLEQDEDLAYDTVAPRRNGAAVAALAAADTVLAVACPDPIGIVRLAQSFGDLPGRRTPIVVVNRVRRGLVGRGDATREVTAALTRHVGVTDVVIVPADFATADAALRAGRTWSEVSTTAPARLVVRDLARRIESSGERSSSRPRRRLLQVGSQLLARH
jgi:MinD-like ATPase involved in chromosome partitioning or flagellar assembly